VERWSVFAAWKACSTVGYVNPSHLMEAGKKLLKNANGPRKAVIVDERIDKVIARLLSSGQAGNDSVRAWG
jgi:hypothetical protein